MDMTTPDHLIRHIDIDEAETAEWIASLHSVLEAAGPERARFLRATQGLISTTLPVGGTGQCDRILGVDGDLGKMLQGETGIVQETQRNHPEITGWAMVGGWPLFTDNALKWPPGSVKAVSVDALPPMLQYLRSGHVQILLAQQVYEWGWQSVALLLDKIHFKKNPAAVHVISPLVPETKANVDAFAKNWEKWLPK